MYNYKELQLTASEYERITSERARVQLPGLYGRSAKGSDTVLRTPLYKGLEPTEAIGTLKKVLGFYLKDYPKLQEAELNTKVVPQSIMLPAKERLIDVKGYYSTQTPKMKADLHLLREAIKRVVKLLWGNNIRRLRPSGKSQVHKHLSRDNSMDKSSGLPEMDKKLAVFEKDWNRVLDGSWKTYPSLWGFRGSRGGQRVFFWMPASAVYNGMRYSIHLIDKLKEAPFSRAYVGNNAVQSAVSNQLLTGVGKSLNPDWSKMDRHFRLKHSYIAYQVIREGFQEAYWDDLWDSIRHEHQIDFMVDLDLLYTSKDHGLGSGGAWTNPLETVYQRVQMEYRALKGSYTLHPDVQCLGDDGSQVTTDSSLEAIEFVTISEKDFDQPANLEDSLNEVGRQVYLRRHYDVTFPRTNKGEVPGVYLSGNGANAAVYPESFHDPDLWSKEQEILRWIQIVENSHNQQVFKISGEITVFDMTLMWYINGDKYQMGLNIENFFKPEVIQRHFNIARQLGTSPTYNQEKRDEGILNFVTYQRLLQYKQNPSLLAEVKKIYEVALSS